MSATFKCKMCGGDLHIAEGSTTCECEYCGTNQTVPSADNEKKMNLFNRANRLRFASEFDKATGVYENIVSEFPEESEAYWGLCLCKYGIEYVDDPVTSKKIPTCHRTSFESIFDDNNFEMALEYADITAQRVYREEAREIDRLQKAILDIAKSESPYDVFICYKETAEDGQRTKDSVMAQDIYDALTDKGYKVFFARITLEDKLGQEYEPYIFSALTSAKVMLVIGTDYEYFNAVWVKNEWSRFLDMMKSDKSKTLIPCYADIDAYDMPKEFKNLQGQDMSKIGFMQDLIRGIGKLINPSSADSLVYKDGTIVDSLAMKVEDYLLIENWDIAEKYSERVLDIDPKYAKGYLYKLMAHFHIASLNDIDNCTDDIYSTLEYQKIMEYADDHLKKELQSHFVNAEISHKKYLNNKYIKLKNLRKSQIKNKLKDIKSQLFKENFKFMRTISSLLIVIFFWVVIVLQVKTDSGIDINVFLCWLFALVYFVCTVRSLSRLSGWKALYCIFANLISFCLIGSICTVVNSIKDILVQRKNIKELSNEIYKLKDQIEQLDQDLWLKFLGIKGKCNMKLLEFFENDEQLYNAIIHAFDQLYHYDYYLISHPPNDKKRKRSWSKKTNVSERAIVFRFAHYLQNELFATNYKLFNLDCEYNRNGDKPKKICALRKNAIPDIILHSRGNNSNNILIMEFKGYWNKDQEDDIKKIEAFVSDDEGYNFKYGIAALIDIDHVKLTLIDKKQQYEYKWTDNPFLTSF